MLSKVLFATLHHKRSRLFEEGLKLLLDEGFPIIVQNTGLDQGFGDFGLEHENIEFISRQDHVSYDEGLMRFKDILDNKEWDIVHFLDNDLFIRDMRYIKRTLEHFEESDLGFASYVENGNNYDLHQYDFKGKTIAEVTDQTFPAQEPWPFYKGNPQWENAAMMFKRDVWNQLRREDFQCTPYYIKRMVDLGVKLGVKKIQERLKYTHAGPGFIHIGNLMKYYYMIESFDFHDISPESAIDLSRIGYFIYQKEKFGDYSPEIERNFAAVVHGMGGREKCLQEWGRLVDGYYEI